MNEEIIPQPTGALTLDTLQRKALKAQAHPLKPVVMIGEAGLTPAVLAEIDRALNSHELIKIRVFGDDRLARTALLDEICLHSGCAPVQHIGKLLVVWRPAPDDAPAAATRRRRKPNAPYQPKKAAGAGQKAPTRRVTRERDTSPKAGEQPRAPTARAHAARGAAGPGAAGARAGARPTTLARGAAIGREDGPGTGARKAAQAVDRPSGKTGSRAQGKAGGRGSVSTERPVRPGRAPILSSPGAKLRVSGGRKR